MSKKFKKGWKEYVNLLEEPYDSCFNELKKYIDCSDSMYEHKDECLEEILDLMISAQQDGVAIESVIGLDHQKFCENLLTSINVTSKAQRMLLRISCFGIMAVVMGLLELAITYIGIPGEWAKDGKINMIHPFAIAMLVVGIDWGMEAIIRKQLVKRNNDTFYKKRGIIKVIIFGISGLIGGAFYEASTAFPRTYEWLFVNVFGLLLIGGAIVLFSVICYILLLPKSDSKPNGRGNNAENETKKITEILEIKYQRMKNRLQKVDPFIEDSESRDKFQRKYLKQCKVTHYLFLLDFVATLGLLLWIIQMDIHEVFLMIAIFILIIISGYGFSLEHKQKKYIAIWRRMI